MVFHMRRGDVVTGGMTVLNIAADLEGFPRHELSCAIDDVLVEIDMSACTHIYKFYTAPTTTW